MHRCRVFLHVRRMSAMLSLLRETGIFPDVVFFAPQSYGGIELVPEDTVCLPCGMTKVKTEKGRHHGDQGPPIIVVFGRLEDSKPPPEGDFGPLEDKMSEASDAFRVSLVLFPEVLDELRVI